MSVINEIWSTRKKKGFQTISIGETMGHKGVVNEGQISSKTIS